MNKRPGLPARGWLFCGALGLAMVGPMMLNAQTAKQADQHKATARSSEPATLTESVQRKLKKLYSRLTKHVSPQKANHPIRQASGSKTASESEQKKSRVRQELEKLYRRDKRRMPPMRLNRLPKTEHEAQQAVRNRSLQSPGSRTQQAAHSRGRSSARHAADRHWSSPSFFKHLFGLKSGKRARHPAGRQGHVPPKPSPAKTAERKPGLLPGFLRSKRSRTRLGPVEKATASAVTNVKPSQDKLRGATDGFQNPFTEVSEAEADRKMDPFTGLKLEDENDRKQPIIRPNPLRATAAKQKQWRTATAVSHVDSPDVPPVPEPDVDEPADNAARQQKLELLAERAHRPGFKGFCPVLLRDQRDLVDASPEFSTKYKGTRYHFATAKAKAQFDANPENYAPVQNGHDVVVLASGGIELDGSLSHAVWYKERLYMFSSRDTLEAFTANPDEYALDSTNSGSE